VHIIISAIFLLAILAILWLKHRKKPFKQAVADEVQVQKNMFRLLMVMAKVFALMMVVVLFFMILTALYHYFFTW
jgi:hypothetical protein